MCFCRRKQREAAGKCRSMEIDGGPPPFCGVVVDDSFDKNPHDDDEYDDDVDDSPDSTKHLPLPQESRSRSMTPVRKTPDDGLDSTQEASSSPEVVDHNDKGDTIATTVTQKSEFQTSEKEEEEESQIEEDDEDEWGDFAAPIQSNPPAKMDDDDDDWGAFDQARPSTDDSNSQSDPNSARSQEARQLAHQQSIEEWAGFENSKESVNSKDINNDDDDDDEWQAEFSSASAAPIPVVPVVPLENLKMLEAMLEDCEFWDDGFQEEYPEDVTTTDAAIIDIPSLFDSETLAEMSMEFEAEKQKYSHLWLALRVIEEAISLKFDWNLSEIRKNHFKSLRINPITVKKETRKTAAAIFDTSNLLLPTRIQTTTTSSESHQSDSSSSSTNNHKTTTSSSPSVDSPSVPAVDFDWDTSGLTNPMNRANQSSAIIDVDFLGSNGVATAYTSTLQKDLEQFGLTTPNGAKTTAASNGSTILETLMSRANGSSANSSSTRYCSPEVLSLDAQKLLERLPDLQYLQSEVLMFPIGTNLPH